jgi:hypothetical protein
MAVPGMRILPVLCTYGPPSAGAHCLIGRGRRSSRNIVSRGCALKGCVRGEVPSGILGSNRLVWRLAIRIPGHAGTQRVFPRCDDEPDRMQHHSTVGHLAPVSAGSQCPMRAPGRGRVCRRVAGATDQASCGPGQTQPLTSPTWLGLEACFGVPQRGIQQLIMHKRP